MNLLLVDLGNTRIKWATAQAGEPVRLAGDAASARIDAGWIRSLARKYPDHHLVLASVVPKWKGAFSRAFHRRATVVSGSMPELRPLFAYPKPAELGGDRIAAAAAMRAEKLFPAIIVACGTATAYTVLDAKGRLCGGAIAPGLQAQLDALVGATAQLPSPALGEPFRALAKSTLEAIRAGVTLSFQGGLKETIAQLTESFSRHRKLRIILTGGHAQLAAEALGGKPMLRPLLVLEGLRIIGERLLKTQ